MLKIFILTWNKTTILWHFILYFCWLETENVQCYFPFFLIELMHFSIGFMFSSSFEIWISKEVYITWAIRVWTPNWSCFRYVKKKRPFAIAIFVTIKVDQCWQIFHSHILLKSSRATYIISKIINPEWDFFVASV